MNVDVKDIKNLWKVKKHKNECLCGEKKSKKVKDDNKLWVMKSERQQKIGLRKVTNNKNESL